jgi:hypothetical protein
MVRLGGEFFMAITIQHQGQIGRRVLVGKLVLGVRA